MANVDLNIVSILRTQMHAELKAHQFYGQCVDAVMPFSQAKNEKILVVGIDGTPDGLQFVKNGEMTLTFFQNAKGQATAAVQVTKALLDKQKVQ